MLAAALPHPAADAPYYRDVLHELIDMGLDLARGLHRQGTAGDSEADPADTAAAFDRIARTIRRTVALARRAAEPLPARADAGAGRTLARRRIIREVEDVIQRKAGGGEADALHAELRERLDAPELEEELDDRPVADIVADICRDLGLAAMPGTHPWMRRTPADVAALCARAARSPVPPSPAAARAAPAGGEADAWPPSPPRSADVDLLHLTPRCRGK